MTPAEPPPPRRTFISSGSIPLAPIHVCNKVHVLHPLAQPQPQSQSQQGERPIRPRPTPSGPCDGDLEHEGSLRDGQDSPCNNHQHEPEPFEVWCLSYDPPHREETAQNKHHTPEDRWDRGVIVLG